MKNLHTRCILFVQKYKNFLTANHTGNFNVCAILRQVYVFESGETGMVKWHRNSNDGVL